MFGRPAADGARVRVREGECVTHTPVRTCIGCRRSGPAAELLRVVAAPGTDGQSTLVADPHRRAGGRGAWLHPAHRCVEAAERRRAFARALRVPGPLDPAPVVAHLARAAGPPAPSSPPPSGDPETHLR